MSVKSLCIGAGMSRQNYYKTRKERQRIQVDEELVVKLVQRERAVQTRLGGRKLFAVLQPELEAVGVRIGRDRFFEVLGRQGLLVEPLPKQPVTTLSAHSLPNFPNRVRDLELTGPNQVWVSDITYIRLEHSFAYLSLITDAYSRKIVGHHLSEDLKTSSCMQALEMALADLPAGAKPIHHSDRGCQYCSHEYVEKLEQHGLGISMTEINHCAENALAERMNGILKQEYGLRDRFRTHEQARKATRQAAELYNCRRPHGSLQMRTPQQVHQKAA